ncbi:MAG: hypothetical protein HQM10_15060 [Candidatus Riflebacteria bacterium]|nr:hypothetical protein [Candidatus Riflebacteria bacterium]
MSLSRFRPAFRCVFILALFLVMSGNAVFSMIKSLSLPDLIRESEIIVIAMVEKITDTGMDERGLSIVKNELLMQKVLKGKWEPAVPIVITTRQSGTPGKTGWLEDQVEFTEKGSRVILFLKKTPEGELQTVNLIQGVWPLDGDKPLGMGFNYTMEQLVEEISKQ